MMTLSELLARVEEIVLINAYKILIHKPERETEIGPSIRRWNSNIKMDFIEKECEVK
jgi:hypothetical protein